MMKYLTQLSNPQRFQQVTHSWIGWLAAVSLILFTIGSIWSLALSPEDIRQGASVRMMYVHVPAAWMSMAVYMFMAVSSLIGYIWRHNLADLAAREAAPFGAGFTFLALVTGSIWGKVTWGVWWDWDPRLVSMLILLFIYFGYISLWRAIDNESRAAKPAALLCIIGAINIPIIKFSVDFWDTLHQKASVIRAEGPAMPASMLWPLLIMALAYMAVFAFYLIVRLHTVLLQKKALATTPSRPVSRPVPPNTAHATTGTTPTGNTPEGRPS
ncbi:MAG: heme ABC transporter permease CcmC [bacterium]